MSACLQDVLHCLALFLLEAARGIVEAPASVRDVFFAGEIFRAIYARGRLSLRLQAYEAGQNGEHFGGTSGQEAPHHGLRANIAGRNDLGASTPDRRVAKTSRGRQGVAPLALARHASERSSIQMAVGTSSKLTAERHEQGRAQVREEGGRGGRGIEVERRWRGMGEPEQKESRMPERRRPIL